MTWARAGRPGTASSSGLTGPPPTGSRGAWPTPDGRERARGTPRGRPRAAGLSCGPSRTARRARRRAGRAPPGDRSPQQGLEVLGPDVRVVAVDEDSGVADGCRQASDVRRHDRGAAGLRLDGDQPEGLAVRGHRDEVRGAVPPHQLRAGHGRGEAHLRADPQPGSKVLESVGVCQPRPAGAPEHGHDELAPPVRVRASRSAAAATRTSGALSGWMRPTNSSTLASCGSPTSARAALVARGEQRQVDAGRHDDDRSGSAP